MYIIIRSCLLLRFRLPYRSNLITPNFFCHLFIERPLVRHDFILRHKPSLHALKTITLRSVLQMIIFRPVVKTSYDSQAFHVEKSEERCGK